MIGLISNPYKDPGFKVLARTATILHSLGEEPVINRLTLAAKKTACPALRLASPAEWKHCQLIISIGGDGTFLSAVHSNYDSNIPIVGINMGSLGFMAEVQPNDLDTALPRLVQGDYDIEERMLLQASWQHAGEPADLCGYALNEVLLTRGGNPRIIPIELYIDGEFIELISSDGLMVSTPTGSTGYALAAGGPIVHPSMKLLQVTPVCPHSLYNRSYIIPAGAAVTLALRQYPYSAVLSLDGRQDLAFSDTDQVTISQADHVLRLVRLKAENFFEALPNKLRGRAYPRKNQADMSALL
ncbi:MAG: NAD(+)/NADH kinase [Oscillospiraceae bacterium]|nr:NAD(+)/NADH kinase [Oscillospiraceae bacterium]